VKAIEELRGEIDDVDAKIAALLVRRASLSDEEREALSAAGLPVRDEGREREVLSRVAALSSPAERDLVCSVFERVLGGARGLVECIARGVAVRGTKVLLCRAKGGTSTYLPGGHVEFGETAREALEREVLEETGLSSRAGEFLGVVENSFLQHSKRHCEINLVYRLELGSGEATSREDWIEFEWCEKDALEGANLLPREMKELCR